jgi:hypothetical protein
MALTVFAIALGGMIVVWCATNAVSFEARHVATPSLAVLPMVVTRAGRRKRWWDIAMVWLCIVVPLAYGWAAVIEKSTIRRLSGFSTASYVSGSSGLYSSNLAVQNVPMVHQFLASMTLPDDVWYFSDPVISLDISGRGIIEQADFMDIPALRRSRFVSRKPRRILALLPRYFEQNGKGAEIRTSFSQMESWSRRRIPGSGYDLWIGTGPHGGR